MCVPHCTHIDLLNSTIELELAWKWKIIMIFPGSLQISDNWLPLTTSEDKIRQHK